MFPVEVDDGPLLPRRELLLNMPSSWEGAA